MLKVSTSGSTVIVALPVTAVGASVQAMLALLAISVPGATLSLTVAWKVTEPLSEYPQALELPRFQVSVPAEKVPLPVALPGT